MVLFSSMITLHLYQLSIMDAKENFTGDFSLPPVKALIPVRENTSYFTSYGQANQPGLRDLICLSEETLNLEIFSKPF
jgi:hypothetical protein